MRGERRCGRGERRITARFRGPGGEGGRTPLRHASGYLRIAEFFGLPVETIFSTEPFPRISDLRQAAGPADDDRPPGRTA